MNEAEFFSTAWRQLCGELAIPHAASEDILKHLLVSYSAPDRHYHNLTHINALIRLSNQLAPAQSANLKLASFFHDVIYDPSRSDNEALSACDFEAWLGPHLTVSVLKDVKLMIESTKHHKATGHADHDLFLDMDMSILGQPRPVYEYYACGIMAEYVPVFGEDAYRKGRVALFIEPTLNSGEIFLTDTFGSYETAARANLVWERDWLMP